MTNNNSSSLTKYRHDLEVIRNTAAQVIKDVGLFNIHIVFSGNEETAYEELKAQLMPELLSLYEDNYSRLQSLFYRIDLSEKKVSAIPSTNKIEMIAAITDLILERELLKVITRKLYAEKNK